MKIATTNSAIMALQAAMILLLAMNGKALAQAGSTGGTVGKQDKSISGSDDLKPAQRLPQSHTNLPRLQNKQVTFQRPQVRGMPIDHCGQFGTRSCDEPTATKWCLSKGFSRAIAWKIENAPKAFRLIDSTTCGTATFDLRCDIFAEITCE